MANYSSTPRSTGTWGSAVFHSFPPFGQPNLTLQRWQPFVQIYICKSVFNRHLLYTMHTSSYIYILVILYTANLESLFVRWRNIMNLMRNPKHDMEKKFDPKNPKDQVYVDCCQGVEEFCPLMPLVSHWNIRGGLDYTYGAISASLKAEMATCRYIFRGVFGWAAVFCKNPQKNQRSDLYSVNYLTWDTHSTSCEEIV